MSGATYAQSFQIDVTTDYQVELDNMAVHVVYLFGYPNDVYDKNTFSGSFYLMRMPAYYPHLLISGEALLAVFF